jgi:hypothetical protein
MDDFECKNKMHELSHHYTDEVVCPYCLEEQSESWEFPDWVESHDCHSCDKKFSIYRNVTINYSTHKLQGE